MHQWSSMYRCLIASVFCGAMLPSLAQEDSATLKKIKETQQITIGHRESSIPFSYLNDKMQSVGYSMDICLKAIEKIKAELKMPGLKVQYQVVTSANRIPLVANGTVDMECGSTTNNSERGKQVSFSINYFYTGTRFLGKKSLNLNTLEDLKGKPISSTSGTTNIKVIQELSKSKNLDFKIAAGKDHAESFLLVDSGRALAFGMDDILLAGFRANAKNPEEWVIFADSIQVEPYAIMMRKGDDKFKKIIDASITEQIKSGELEKTYKKWFMSPIPPKNRSLDFPMPKALKDNLKNLSDKPAM